MIRLSTALPLLKKTILSDVEKSYEQFKNRKDIGFSHLPSDEKAQLQSKALGQQILTQFNHLVLIGIGGSSMGPRTLAELTQSAKISFLDNVDSVETEKVLNRCGDLSKTAWLVISKTGTTIEVLCNLDIVIQHYAEKNIPFFQNTFFITEDTSNPLKKLATEHNRPCLHIPLDVGGRFSVLSPVGLVVAEYLGISSKEMLDGAALAVNNKTDVVFYSAHYLASHDRHEYITTFWFYNSNMRWFGSWLQQLWAESLGKKTDLKGGSAFPFSTPMTSIGTCDQHSILQQVLEGPKNKFVNIFRFQSVEKSRFTLKNPQFAETQVMKGLNYGDLIKAEALATEQALRQSDISTILFELESVDAKNIGYLFMFFQMVVATLGEYANINAFDQPAVALGKKLTLQFLNKR